MSYEVTFPIPQRPNNPTSMELAIYRFQVKARKYHINQAALANNKDKLASARSERDAKHLDIERATIVSHSKAMENKLIEYRKESKDKNPLELLKEEHHPTNILARNLRAVGEPKPTTFHEAHHIIPGKGRYIQASIIACRLNLHRHGVGINDPLNGIWLRNFKRNKPHDWATEKAPGHREIHRHNYESWITANFSNNRLPDQIFLNRLNKVKRQLRDGTMPEKVMQKKDANWDGSV